MKFDRFVKAVKRNIGVKIVSFFFAVFLWIHVTAQQGENQAFRIPLSLAGIPDSLTIIHEVPQFVEITIRGSRSSLLKLRLFGRLKGTVDLSMAKKGRMNIPLSAEALNLAKDFDPRDISIDEPKSLALNFEQVISKSVPVKIAYKGGIPEDILITDSPVIIPARVKISGASSIVQSITFLASQEIDIRNRKGKFSQDVGLNTGGLRIVTVPDKVLIEMEIRKKAVRTIANIPPTLLQDDGAPPVEYSPRVVSITIEGPEEIVKKIVPDDLSVILNITVKKPGTYRLEPEVIVPKGIEKYFLDVDAFEITILPPVTGDGGKK